MNKNWWQIISNTAILVGLVVVIVELDRNRQHVRAELLHADFTDILAHQFALMGENPAEAIALASANPEHLDDAQKIVVDAHLRALFVRLDSYCYIADRTGVYVDQACLSAVPRILKTYFNYEYAREWWGSEREMPRPWAKDLYDAFDEGLGFVD